MAFVHQSDRSEGALRRPFPLEKSDVCVQVATRAGTRGQGPRLSERRGRSQKRGFTNNQPRLRQRLRRLPTPSSSRVSGQRAASLSRPGAPPVAGPPPHRALVPATGEERPPREGQPEPRTRTSAAERPCAPHFTAPSALSHVPSPSRQASSGSLSPSTRGSGGRGAKDRAQEPRKQPPEAACTAPARQVSAETARPPGDARHQWTKPRAVSKTARLQSLALLSRRSVTQPLASAGRGSGEQSEPTCPPGAP